MPYANLLTLPSSFPLPEVEQARRAWVSRSLICLGLCLGLCLVFITTVSIAPIGPLGRHFTDGLHTYLERRQASTAEPRERRTEQAMSHGSNLNQQVTTLFMTAGWDDARQVPATFAPSVTGQPIDIMDPNPGTVSATPAFIENEPMLPSLTDASSHLSKGPGRPATAHFDYPSLNPSIGAQAADAQAGSSSSTVRGHTLTASASGTIRLDVQEMTAANSIHPAIGVLAQPEHSSSAVKDDDVEKQIFISGVYPMNIPLPLLNGPPAAISRPFLWPSVSPIATSLHHAKSEDQSYSINGGQNPPAGMGPPAADVPRGSPLWNGPLPESLQPLIPLPDAIQGTQTVDLNPSPVQPQRGDVSCPPCPTCQSCPATGEIAHGDDGSVNGPCSGQGFRCDECLNGWFCPPQETPAQVLTCGLGWPCFHCNSGSFCIPGTAPAPEPNQGDQLPVPVPTNGPPPADDQGPPPGQQPVPPVLPSAAPTADVSLGPPQDQQSPPTDIVVPSGFPHDQTPAGCGARPGQQEPSFPDSEPPAEESEVILFPPKPQPSATDNGKNVPSLPIPPAESPQSNIPSVGTSATEGGLQWHYVGCFQDDVRRALVGAQPLDYLRGDMSPPICVAHCEARGLHMAGVENGQECWCGSAIRGDAVRLPESCCEMPCQGNVGAVCGGDWAVGVFLKTSGEAGAASQAYDGSS